MASSWRRASLTAAGLAAFVYGTLRLDLYLRARSCVLEGEKWLSWSRRPELKKAHFDALHEARRAELERARAAGEIGALELERRLELAAGERDEAVADSSLKIAHAWFRDAAELHAPPETAWTRRGREREREVRELWRRELAAKGVDAKDWMLD